MIRYNRANGRNRDIRNEEKVGINKKKLPYFFICNDSYVGFYKYFTDF